MAQYTNLTASGVVKKNAGKLRGIVVNSTSAGTIRLYDDPATTNNPIGGVMTPAAGVTNFGTDGIDFSKGIYALITGTIDATFLFN